MKYLEIMQHLQSFDEAPHETQLFGHPPGSPVLSVK